MLTKIRRRFLAGKQGVGSHLPRRQSRGMKLPRGKQAGEFGAKTACPVGLQRDFFNVTAANLSMNGGRFQLASELLNDRQAELLSD